MRAGELREKVTFQRSTPGAGDGAGNQGNEFVDIPGAVRISADLAPERAAEVVIAEGVQGRTLYAVVVRYSAILANVNVGDIMVDVKSGRQFNVKAPPINPDKRRRRLKIMVEYGGANG